MTGLDAQPFRGLRFDPHRVRALAAVTSPPYDVVEKAAVGDLERAEPHNVVRLILPRAGHGASSDRYQRAAARLRSWREHRVLTADPRAGFYVYEQVVPGPQAHTVRGIVAAVRLNGPAGAAVRPHEDVMPGPVADRFALLRATATNLEAALLVHDGSAASAQSVAQVCDSALDRTPLLDATTVDGHRHRLWSLVDEEAVTTLRSALAERRALIADGHHRWAAAQQLSAAHRAAGREAGPWDRALAMLVDATRTPLRLGAIHRVVAALDWDTALSELGAAGFRVTQTPFDAATDLDLLAAAGQTSPVLALVSGTRAALVTALNVRRSDSGPDSRDVLDTELLHDVLLPTVWRVEEDRVTYHHEVPGALAAAAALDGVAVLLNPPTIGRVLSMAARGLRMPRKTTSFDPKPRSGLVMRAFDLEPDRWS